MPTGTTLEVTDSGIIVDILSTPNAAAIHYEGVLAPGFVNAHCHLELSHMKGAVPEGTGLIPFLKTIPTTRNRFSDKDKEVARKSAFESMLKNGIVAVGDIANTTDTTDLRRMDKMHFCTFVEAIGFTPGGADRSLRYAAGNLETFQQQKPSNKIRKQYIVPHAPYSVSADLFRLISKHNPDSILTIHNQESEEENKFYKNKIGDVRTLLQQLGVDDTYFQPTGKTSLQSYLPLLGSEHQFIFVHNTYATQEDVAFATFYAPQSFWCLCPNANKYIEQRLPDIDMLMTQGANICIGTDSLASNHELSILSELKTIKQHYAQINWETLLRWGTSNGAVALQMDDTIGTIERGKNPGLVLINGLEQNENVYVSKVLV